jgi:radical SAM family uncharacterized protein
MAAALKTAGIPLASLENGRPLGDFDVIGFSLGYELTFTNVLNMLHLARIPVLARERDDSHPLIIAGGCCTLNPEPMADFIDLFIIGEAEELLAELVACIRDGKRQGSRKEDLLRRLATLPGVYVPSLYRVDYRDDGTFQSITPAAAEASARVKRQLVAKLPPPVTKPVVPYIEVVHDRGAIEISRGCSWGCRFCNAGMVYRPVRQRPREEVVGAIADLIANCGYDEASLVSLSTSDYSDISGLVASITRHYGHQRLALSLPSLRIGTDSVKLIDSLPTRRKTGLTFAPEAGSQRLQRVINKYTPEDEVLDTAAAAFSRGWTNLKLYFMLGLPTETTDDIESIIHLAHKIHSLGKKAPGRRPQLRLSLSTFVPKPHTPFQWAAQENETQLNAKHELLRQGLRRGIRLSWQDPKTSLLEAALSRGDRRLGRVIHRAWQLGAGFDGWSECFNYEIWRQAFAEAGLEPGYYAQRQRPLSEPLPWGHISSGITAAFLKREYRRATEATETADCNQACSACGLQSRQPDCQQRLLATRNG